MTGTRSRRQCCPCVPHTFSAVWLSRALSSPPGAEATASAEQFSTAQVAEFFHEVTGDSLRAQPGDDLDALSIERGDSGRYGSFYIVVMRKPDDEDFYKIENALPLKVEQRGVYWHQEGASWTAMKRYGNVVLAWGADERELDDRFERLHTVLTGLGEPPEQIRAKLGEPASSGTDARRRPRPAPAAAQPRSAADPGADRAGRDPAERLRARPPRQGPVRARRRRAQEHRRRAVARPLRRAPAGRRAALRAEQRGDLHRDAAARVPARAATLPPRPRSSSTCPPSRRSGPPRRACWPSRPRTASRRSDCTTQT